MSLLVVMVVVGLHLWPGWSLLLLFLGLASGLVILIRAVPIRGLIRGWWAFTLTAVSLCIYQGIVDFSV